MTGRVDVDYAPLSRASAAELSSVLQTNELLTMLLHGVGRRALQLE